MNDDVNNVLMAKAADCQTEGEQTWGKRVWNQLVASVGRQGVRPEVMQAIVTSDDPVANFTRLGTQALLNEMQAAEHPRDARNIETIYEEIRSKQREEHLARHGRRRT
jgi:hypothetical protein